MSSWLRRYGPAGLLIAIAVALYHPIVGIPADIDDRPALRDNNASVAWINGAILGGFAYGTYALTNYAMLTDWAWHLVWTDMIWGVVLSSLVSFIGYRVARPAVVGGATATTS